MNKKRLIIYLAAVCLAAGAFLLWDPPADRSETEPSVPASQKMLASFSPAPVPPETSVHISRPRPPKENYAGPQEEKLVVLKPATQETGPPPSEPEQADPKIEYQLNQIFEAEAIETFPVYTVQTHNPVEEMKTPQFFGPRKNEIWIRIKPENAREMKEIMAQVADLYRMNAAQPEDEITVMHWVGGRPWAKETYAPESFNN